MLIKIKYYKKKFSYFSTMSTLLQVTGDNGKVIELPHPVAALRIYNAGKGDYDEIDPLLTGAPSDAEAKAYWDNLIKELKEKNGEEYMNKILGLDEK